MPSHIYPRKYPPIPLAKALDAAGCTNQYLAKHLGVDVSQVARWVCGHSTPVETTQRKIVRVLRAAGVRGVSAASLWPPQDEAA
jgi:transcriptional regulator with XRE-family HTH domain